MDFDLMMVLLRLTFELTGRQRDDHERHRHPQPYAR